MIATMRQSTPILGFFTREGKYVCRDEWCLKLMEAQGDRWESLVRIVPWDHNTCDWCGEKLVLSAKRRQT